MRQSSFSEPKVRDDLRTVSVVIVNWNSGDRLLACLDAVAASDMRPNTAIADVIVVDNASSDRSLETALSRHPATRVVGNTTNCGFAAACNLGARTTTSDYLLFLNPDTRAGASSIGAAVECLESKQDQRIGICGVRHVDHDARTTSPASRFPSLRTLLGDVLRLSTVAPRVFPPHLLRPSECERSRPVDQVSGAFFVVRRDLFEALAGFDERFFMYYEEVDLSFRAAQLGWTSWLYADAVCYHEGGASSRAVPANRLLYNVRSRLLFARKHFSPARFIAVAGVSLVIEPPLRVIHAVATDSWASAREVAMAYAALGRWIVRSAITGPHVRTPRVSD